LEGSGNQNWKLFIELSRLKLVNSESLIFSDEMLPVIRNQKEKASQIFAD